MVHLLLLAYTASAQSDLTVRDAVAEALKAHPALESARARIAVFEGQRRQAGLMPNPRLILQSENTRPYGNPSFVYTRDTDNFAYLQQTIETAGKRDRRVDSASAAVRRAELELEVARRQVATRVKQAYWQAAGARRVEDLLGETARNFARIIEYHENRVKAGAMAESDLIRVRLEGERIELARNQASLDAERARIHLLREMGRTEFGAVSYADPIDPAAAAPDADIRAALQQRPELNLSRHLVEQARQTLRLQQANSRPNVDVLFGYKRTAGLDTMLGGVQVDLPFFNRNVGGIAAADAEIRASESAHAAAEALVRAEVAAAQRDYEIRRRQIGEGFPRMRVQAAESARIAEAAYREGGSDVLRLLDAQRVLLETELLYARALAEHRQSIVALEAALGAEP